MTEQSFDTLNNMKPKTLKALKESIAHWERLAAGANEQVSRGSCALCLEFNDKDLKGKEYCDDCPVKEHTGHRYCNRTPFEIANDYISNISLLPRDVKDKKWLKAAAKERDFLKSLIPKRKIT